MILYQCDDHIEFKHKKRNILYLISLSAFQTMYHILRHNGNIFRRFSFQAMRYLWFSWYEEVKTQVTCMPYVKTYYY